MILTYHFFYLKLVREGNARILDIFPRRSYFGTSLGITFLVGLILLFLGWLLIGIIWALNYSMSLFATVDDKGFTTRGSLQFSSKIVKGFKGKLFLVLLLLAILPFTLLIAILSSSSFIEINPGPIADFVDFVLLFSLLVYPFVALIFTSWLGASFAVAYNNLTTNNSKQESSPV